MCCSLDTIAMRSIEMCSASQEVGRMNFMDECSDYNIDGRDDYGEAIFAMVELSV